MKCLKLLVAILLLSSISNSTNGNSIVLVDSIESPNPGASDQFGMDVEIVGDKIVIGARVDDTRVRDAGANYIFDLNGDYLYDFQNPTPSSGDHFGQDLGSHNGYVLLGDHGNDVGHQNSGSAYLVNLGVGSGSTIHHFYNMVSSNGRNFGWDFASVGNNLFISELRGNGNVGSVHLYDGTTFGLIRTFANPYPGNDDRFGSEIEADSQYLFSSANLDDVSALNSGAVYVHDTNTGALVDEIHNPALNTERKWVWSFYGFKWKHSLYWVNGVPR